MRENADSPTVHDYNESVELDASSSGEDASLLEGPATGYVWENIESE